MSFLETSYNKALNLIFNIANPIKKTIINTHCKVHMFLNFHALNILKNDKHLKEYNFFVSYIDDINEGSIWADQDFKSSNHFYNPYKDKGLYGRKSAMDLGVDYYNEALELWHSGDFNKSLFYLGAALHIIQDMTIPQHANIRLLDNHHQYELYIISTYKYVIEFRVDSSAYLLKSIDSYIKFNARVAIKTYRRFMFIEDNKTRFYRMGKCGLPLAIQTTAGAMIMFFKDIWE